MTGSDRIPYVTDRDAVPEEHRHHFDEIEETRGGVRGPFAVLMNSPEVAGRVANLGTYVRFEGELPNADRELAILATARAFDCAYEWAAHVPIARDAGLREEAIDVVAEEGATDDLDDGEATVIEYCRELLYDHRVSDDTFRAALERFGESGVTELTATAGYYGMIACALNAFEVFPDEDQPQLP